MKETQYTIYPYGRKWRTGVGVGYLVLGFFYFDQIQPPLTWLRLILWIYFIIAGLYYIYDGATSSQSLSISDNGILLTDKKREWRANWEQFCIVEDDLVSFIIQFDKEEFRYVRKSLPDEVLVFLKEGIERHSLREDL